MAVRERCVVRQGAKGLRFPSWLSGALLIASCSGEETTSEQATPDEGGDQGFAPVPCGEIEPLYSGTLVTGREQLAQIEVVETSPAPPEKFESDWIVRVLDMSDDAMSDAELLEVVPFMPVHGHDGITPPLVAKLEEPGEFEVSKLNMWMGGPWEVQFAIQTPDGEDFVSVDVCIED